ncbi:MAG: DUF4291 domain-containing protein [Anaerolineae bacterium]|nr:DUF4291 domain-containing protein [Anaerolineae bacterium]
MTKQIYAAYDTEGIYVYQAFKPSIVQAALEKGTFGQGFSLDRMTWIKPSFGWMLYRSGYATKSRQEAILKIKLTHEGFLAILGKSVKTTYPPDLYASIDEWKRALNASDVRHQWDPERALKGHKLDRRAIQIGMRGQTVRRYVHEWIISLEEVTNLAHAVKAAVDVGQSMPVVPEERAYDVDEELGRRLGVTIFDRTE